MTLSPRLLGLWGSVNRTEPPLLTPWRTPIGLALNGFECQLSSDWP
jgi:hypothetical protein